MIGIRGGLLTGAGGLALVLFSGCLQYEELAFVTDIPSSSRSEAVTLVKNSIAMTPGGCVSQQLKEMKSKGDTTFELPEGGAPLKNGEAYCIRSTLEPQSEFIGYGVCIYDVDSQTTRINVVVTRALNSTQPVPFPQAVSLGAQPYFQIVSRVLLEHGIKVRNNLGVLYRNTDRSCGDH